MLGLSNNSSMMVVRTAAAPGANTPAVVGESSEHKLDLPTMKRVLTEVLNRFGPTDAAPERLQRLAEQDPQLFFTAAIERLGLEGCSPGHRRQSLRLFDAPAFLVELVRSRCFSDGELKEFCAKYAREDSLLDVKLARLMPGRRSNSCHLETRFILRILDILDEISPGPRLLMVIGHLTGYSERRVASKAALLVGRRLQNHEWIERHLSSPDPRVRANVVEALWGLNSALAVRTLRKCLQDENNRVRGNAMIGMHMLGDPDVNLCISQLTQDSRPMYRQTAAWVIGRVRDEQFRPLLEAMLADQDERVRQSAENALARFCTLAPMTAAAESSAGAAITAASESAITEDMPPQLSVQNDSAAVTPMRTTTPPVSPAKDTAPPDAREPVATAYSLRLDGRYVTGD